ncbi:MAG: radical SAM protein [Armatimonadetes bacterium]|nr:radical SAM protein [Armatimonadota bacterium]
MEYIAGSLVAAGIPAQLTSPNELRASVPGFHSEFSLFSSTTAEYPRVCIEAAQAKNDGRITVIGGYHACGCTNDTLNGPFDYAISGEGELAAVELIRTIVDGTSNCIRNGDRTGVSPRHFVADRLTDLDALPFPLRSEARLGTYIPYDLMWPAHSQQKNIAIVLASRGCDHSCSFCASQTVWGTGVRFRSPENVVREIRDLKSQFDTNTVVFVDQSLGQVKEWTIDLCNTLESSRLNLSWYHMSNLDIDREALAAMGRAGCRKIGLGIDGLSPRAMELMKPLNSQNTESINELLDYCNSLGIFVKAYLMIGSPWETEDDIKEYMEHIGNIRANEIKISYLTPFPGTRDWDRYSPHLLTKDWSHFDTVSMPVVYNPIISVQQYHEIRTRLFRAFYGSKTYADVTKRMLDKYPHYIESYREFLYYLKTFDMISGEEAWIRLINDQNKTIAYSSAPPEGNVI